MTDHFLQEKFDNRRFLLLNVNKIWQIAVGAVAGACLFAFLYYLKTDILQGEPLYRAQTLYGITFDREQVDNIHDYYNDYTWNEILDSDQIAGRAAGKLGDLSKEEVAAATTIPTMSDIRFIWVYVDMESREQADRVMAAVGEALQEFALATDGFTEIAVWDVKETGQIREISLIGRMTVGGAVIGALAACFIICFASAMDDSVYTEQDAEERLGVPPAGVIMKSGKQQPEFFEKELMENLKKLLGDKLSEEKIGIIGILSADSVCGFSAEREKEYLKEVLEKCFPNAEVVEASVEQTEGEDADLDASILPVPYGKKNGKTLELVWKDLSLQERLPDAVVIVGADEKFYRRYYRK
ncbi:MAG: hypothetical protein K2J95_10215 [Lachnospiraceae bacterium]|nr:hypothetical protein [Lachnospiraceae bacterium]